MFGGVTRKLTVIAVAVSMTASPAFATASVARTSAPISPMVALSIFGSQASAAALCGSAATAATAAAAATAAQAPAGGCVLPLVDTPPPPPIAEAAPLLPPSGGIGITPILLGLAGIALLAALIAGQDDDNDNDTSPPISVN